MNRLLELLLDRIYAVGMSTVNAISRTGTYEPEEDVELAEWAEKSRC